MIELPLLPYGQDALAPYISKQTVEFHYGKHHQTYVTNLNKLIQGTPHETMDLTQIMMSAQGPVFNNAAQVWNHTFYWEQMSPTPSPKPLENTMVLIEKKFGNLENFFTTYSNTAVSLFGSGWCWLVLNPSTGELEIVNKSNAENPLLDGLKPLLTIDVWEHAYYLDYQNRRAEYVANIFKLIDWNMVEAKLL